MVPFLGNVGRRRGLALGLLGALFLALIAAGPSWWPAAAGDGDVAPGRVIVKPREGRSAAALRVDAMALGATAVLDQPRIGAQIWLVATGAEREVARRAAARPEVEYAEPDRIKRLKLVPNDQYYGTHQWNMPKINAPSAWEVTIGDPSVKVAVIDSGFDLTHPDAPLHLQLGCDYVVWGSLNKSGACPAVSGDPEGHGTHVGGIVAARQNNLVGITGVAPNVTLLVIRTADQSGSSYTSDVAAAIHEATDTGARVINLSLGGPDATTTEYNAITYALSKGVVIVAAAGNEYDIGNAPSYPAAFNGVIAVGSASDADQHAYFSNTGSYVSLVAPGGSALDGSDSNVRHWITSLYPVGLSGGAPPYQLEDGTSQAAPHVAGVAGLMFSARPSLTGANVAALLKSTARPLGSPIPNVTFGYGYLDASAAVRAAQSFGATPTPIATPAPTPVVCLTPIPAIPVPVPTQSASRPRLTFPRVPRNCLMSASATG